MSGRGCNHPCARAFRGTPPRSKAPPSALRAPHAGQGVAGYRRPLGGGYGRAARARAQRASCTSGHSRCSSLCRIRSQPGRRYRESSDYGQLRVYLTLCILSDVELRHAAPGLSGLVIAHSGLVVAHTPCRFRHGLGRQPLSRPLTPLTAVFRPSRTPTTRAVRCTVTRQVWTSQGTFPMPPGTPTAARVAVVRIGTFRSRDDVAASGAGADRPLPARRFGAEPLESFGRRHPRNPPAP